MSFLDVKLPSLGAVKVQRGLALEASSFVGAYSADFHVDFFRDFHTLLAKKFTELAPDPRSGADRFVGGAASGEIILVRKGDECRWAEGVPAAQADAMLKWLESL